MAMIELSASRARDARECPPSIRTEGLQVVTSPLPKIGLAMHHGLHLGIQYGQHMEVEDLAAMFAVEDVDDLQHVMSQAWDAWKSLRGYFGDNPMCEFFLEHRFPGLHLTGHVDVLGLAPMQRQIRIADWKSSWQEEDHGDQIRCYALLALENYPDYDEVWAAVVPPRKPTYSARTYHREELREWLKAMTERLTGRGSEQYHVGEQCIRCPRAATCPSIAALIRRGDRAFDVEGVSTDEDLCREVYVRIRVLEAACDATRKALKAKVAAAGGRIGDLVLTEEKRETIRYTPASQHILMDEGFVSDDWEKIAKLSKTEIKKLRMDKAPRGQKGAAWEATLNQLREVGAVETQYIQKLELRRCQDERTDSDRELSTSDDGAIIAPDAKPLAGPGACEQPGRGPDQP